MAFKARALLLPLLISVWFLRLEHVCITALNNDTNMWVGDLNYITIYR